MEDVTKEIKSSLAAKKLVIGSRSTVKGLKRGEVHTVILASNCPEQIKKEMEHYNLTGGAKLKISDKDSIFLGQTCGKPFKILAVGIRK